MNETFSRTELVLGKEAVEKLQHSHVALFGLGGVGGYCLEALVRSGVGKLDLFDKDRFAESNLNRQILATRDTLGRLKTDVAKERALSINPDIEVKTFPIFYLPENADETDLSGYDYVIDAIDTVSGKLALIEHAKAANVPIISCMGAGNKTDPLAFQVSDIEKTTVCPLAKVMRKELKAKGIKGVKAVFSTEPAIRVEQGEEKTIGSLAPVVAVAGLLLANEVIRDLIRS
ncbi:MAG: tRNA threonylcarbamoyladenosine dehydratase [Lachnospiraceae bacterium]|nr:tRNA threonylcarbamoyladenosine dehydratase [Lachnospiraceae bacterium]